VDDYPRWCRYLALYRPMVAENSVVYVELRESDAILSPLPDEVYVSMFVNEKTYLTVSNFESAAYELRLKDSWRDRVTGNVADTFTVETNKILCLEKMQ
jgi:isopentenyldiphosphate isomerase